VGLGMKYIFLSQISQNIYTRSLRYQLLREGANSL
jgi:hypothetical protein